MRTIQGILVLVTGLILAACGGGDNVCYGGPGSDLCATTTSTSKAASVDVVASSSQVDSAGGAVTISAIVKDAGNVGLAAMPVVFSSDSGTLTSVATVTDATGLATAQLSAGADKSSRTITVSVSSGSAVGKLSLPVTTSSATSVEVLASAVQVDTGGDPVTVSAIVKDSNNVSITAAPVVFATDSGTLTSAATVTDATGLATAKLSAGANKSNRTVTVTVTSGTTLGKVSLPVVGTSLSYSGPTTLPLGQSATLALKATDGKGSAIAGLSIAVASSLNNGLSSTSVTTSAQGTATVQYTATHAGTDTLTFTGAGASTTANVKISAENFVFVSPAAGTQIPVGIAQTFTVRYLSGGAPQVGRTVNFAATAGTVTPSTATTDANGQASAQVVSSTASPATVQATLVGAVAAQATVPIEFVATVPAALVLQVSPTAVGPNAAGSTAQQAQLVARVTDANGNPVKGVTVNFNRVADPSGGNLNQASAVTDSSGMASVQYIAGALTTASNGVSFTATVAGTATVVGGATLTVSQSALFIALGTGNTITNIDPQTYRKDWMVMVTDANGVAVPNIDLTIKALPLEYAKGWLVWNGTSWVWASTVQFCPNEDLNYNGVLDAGEDQNGNGVLDPGNVISVSTSTATSSGSTGTIRTDATGRATISLIYAESYVPWVKIKLRAEAVVSGTESSKEASFYVDGASSDFTDEKNPPAGVVSPFGVNACGVAN